MADTRYLELRHLTWSCVVPVPRPLHGQFGKKLRRSLGTHDLAVAQLRRWSVYTEFRHQIATACDGLADRDIVAEGLKWRDTLARIKGGDLIAIKAHSVGSGEMDSNREHPPSPQEVATANAEWALGDAIGYLRDAGREPTAALLSDVASGRATPLLHYLEDWLRQGGTSGPYTERTKPQLRGDLKEFAAWCQTAGVPQTVQAVTKSVTGRLVADRLAAPGSNRTTINRKISALSAFWVHLVKIGQVEGNPWTGTSLRKLQRDPDNCERPFTAPELIRLLSGPASQDLADLMRIAALTGARLEAIYGLTVARCAGGWFLMPRQKREPRDRRVPIHSDLAAIIARRCHGQPGPAFIFPDASKRTERSAAISKAFGRYRQLPGVAVHELPDGVRRSFVNFHSFRRWFVTMAEQAGQQVAIFSAVTGHVEGRRGMALGRYSGGPSDAQLRACVEAVHLPPLAASPGDGPHPA